MAIDYVHTQFFFSFVPSGALTLYYTVLEIVILRLKEQFEKKPCSQVVYASVYFCDAFVLDSFCSVGPRYMRFDSTPS